MGRYQRIAQLAEVNEPGLQLADLATGAGRQLRAVLEIAPSDIQVHAVDGNSALEDDLLLDGRVRGVIADLEAPLPFDEASLDRVISLNVAEHVPDPAAHIADILRVLKPGGLLVLAHSDWDTAMFASEDDALTRALVDQFVRTVPTFAERADGFMGRKLLHLAQTSAFELVTVETWADAHRRFDQGSVGWKVAAGMVLAASEDPELAPQAKEWFSSMQRMAAEEHFLFAVTDVAIVLRKPA